MTEQTSDARLWGEVSAILKSELGAAAWGRWIDPLVVKTMSRDSALLSAPSAFVADWVSRHYVDDISAALRDVGGPCGRVVVEVDAHGAPTSAHTTAPEPAQAPRPIPAASFMKTDAEGALPPSAPLDSRFTFEQFVVGRPNELAHAAARRVAEGDSVTFNPVFLHGGVGLGKTHLMHAINWRLRELKPDCKVLYLSAEQFMYKFIQALRQRSTIDFKQQFRSVDVLMVDDVQFIAGQGINTRRVFPHVQRADRRGETDRHFRRPRTG